MSADREQQVELRKKDLKVLKGSWITEQTDLLKKLVMQETEEWQRVKLA